MVLCLLMLLAMVLVGRKHQSVCSVTQKITQVVYVLIHNTAQKLFFILYVMVLCGVLLKGWMLCVTY